MREDELAGWYRVGGHRLQFYATDAEITEWLLEMLPAKFGPYSVLGREWHDGHWEAFEYPLDSIASAIEAHPDAINWWVRSEILSPHLPAGDDARHSFGGLILVQPGRERNGVLGDAGIAVVDRIRHELTGEERRQPEYLQIFERPRRSMRKRLVVKTMQALPDGSLREDWPMTARAADAHSRGEVTFAAKPTGLRD